MNAHTVQVQKLGKLTLPKELRSKYAIKDGDTFTLTDLGDGSFLIVRQTSQVNRLGSLVEEVTIEEKISFNDLMNALYEERVG